MAQSLSKVIIHIVFSTKNRVAFLKENIRLKTHAYIATIIRDMNSNAYRVGGFLLLFAPPEKHGNIRQKLTYMRELNFEFESSGSKIIFSQT